MLQQIDAGFSNASIAGTIVGLFEIEQRSNPIDGISSIEASMSRTHAVVVRKAAKEAVRPHQPRESNFKAIMAEEIEWKPFAAFPPSARLAVLVGQPTQPGPYTIRVKVPAGVKLMPHKHPEDRVYTVISGVFYIGLGDEFVEEKLHAYAPGTVIILPGNTSHFHWAKSGEYITQVSAIGPLGLEYVSPKDDPRNQSFALRS
jgi:quercetin dioxygenase-like cupin family protein